MSQRVATIDLGSNSCVFLVVEDRGGQLQRVTSDVAFTRLGQGVDHAGCLAEDAVERTLGALEIFIERARQLEVEQLSCVGTAALREASNRESLMEAVRALGCPIRAVSGMEEAALSYRAACFDGSSQDGLMIDVGGASTELAWGDQGVLAGAISVPIGSVRLTERFDLTAPAQPGDLDKPRRAIADALSGLPNVKTRPIMAVAGTATTAAQCALGLLDYDPERLDHVVLSEPTLRALLDDLLGMETEARVRRYGLPMGRADVLPMGLLILLGVLDRMDRHELVVRDRGVGWGEALNLLVGA